MNLIVTKTPDQVHELIDNLFAVPVAMEAIEVLHTSGRAIVYRGDAPNSLEVLYAREAMESPFERTKTAIKIVAYDEEGKTIANAIAERLASV